MVVAKRLRVSVRSVQRWRAAWQEDGSQALRSRGSAARPKLSEALARTGGRTRGSRLDHRADHREMPAMWSPAR
ncbi:helix-turn-helix domain-containing protein [Streptomyces sp. NPDC051684]|uniref:helix-turn-helix domain-containing protein n=1 Tax=Streptomyces sp. NPDC051684 TaxID=3365670 RepID=UPI003797C133